MSLEREQFPSDTVREYIHDIFGWTDSGGAYHEGLVDCPNIAAFNTTIESLKE